MSSELVTAASSSPWARSAALGAAAGTLLVVLEAALALAWPAPGAVFTALDLSIGLLVTATVGAAGGLLARLVWRRAPAAVAWLPLAALLAPQLLRPHGLPYAWDPVLSGALLVLPWLLPRLGAGLGALVILAVPAAVAVGLDRGDGPAGEPGRAAVGAPDILLITVDTLRADAGLQLPEPEGWRVYEQAISGAPWTLPAMVSLFSGAPVRDHMGGLPAQKGGGYTQPGELPLWLPEALADRGYRCAAFTSNPYLTRDFGFARGFHDFVHADAFREPFLARRALERALHQLTGRVERLRRERDLRVAAEAAAWLAEPPEAPWFVWVHLLAPHEYPRDTAAPVPGWVPGTEDPGALRVAYGVNVGATQELVAGLVAAVDSAEVLVAFTADHGEQLGEDGVFGHGLALGDRELRVPLALRGPGVEPGVVREQVSTADLVGALLVAETGARVEITRRDQAPVGGLRRRNKAGTFAFREPGPEGVYSDDLPATLRARAQGEGPLIEPDESTRRALEALGYVD